MTSNMKQVGCMSYKACTVQAKSRRHRDKRIKTISYDDSDDSDSDLSDAGVVVSTALLTQN